MTNHHRDPMRVLMLAGSCRRAHVVVMRADSCKAWSRARASASRSASSEAPGAAGGVAGVFSTMAGYAWNTPPPARNQATPTSLAALTDSRRGREEEEGCEKVWESEVALDRQKKKTY